ncbi:MAG: metallophosphoesterase, partial [Phycisphaerales bacterium]|nr:metallophosphoesterase [Phycisphaerales bacterium]
MFTTTQRTSIVVAIACAVAVAAGASTARAEKFSFGVMGDTQWTGMQAGVFGGENTVSTAIARAVNDQFVSHGVKFVIQTGDLTDTTGEPALQRRLIANEALYNNGIAFFGLRGNHESDNETSYPGANSYFKNNYIPGSAGYANYSAALSGASVSVAPDGMSYSVTYNGTKVVLLDYNAASGTMTGPTGTNAAITWLGSELPSNALDRNYEQAFVFQHKNILGQNHKDNMFGSNNTANVDVRDSFIKTLADGGVRYNVSGHDHMHYRSLITTQDGLASITQQISASCSTKFYTPDAPYSGFDTPIAQQLYSIGYYVYTIDGPLVTVDFYATSHLNNGTGSNNSNLYLRLENGNITTTETPVWIRSETFGYSLNGKRFLVESGESLSGVTDTSPFAAQTTMSLGGNNTSEVQ